MVSEQSRLFRLAYLLTGDRFQAEDVVADVFARSWQALDQGRIAHPSAYLRRAVCNAVRHHRRRLAVQRRALLGLSVNTRQVTDDGSDRDLLLRALIRLPPRQRAVVVLRFWEDRSEQEVAVVLGVSLGTVKAQASRGLARLRKELS
ncbi:MAG: SigE family RNA polymerase sigma factor [Acidobacteriota bacterium]|nr:SigE family RNA polymerase sigma factor [Acidobacteriota bacterium]